MAAGVVLVEYNSSSIIEEYGGHNFSSNCRATSSWITKNKIIVYYKLRSQYNTSVFINIPQYTSVYLHVVS